jgi:predicted transcriptional regulator
LHESNNENSGENYNRNNNHKGNVENTNDRNKRKSVARDNRTQILEYIQKNPGTHLRKVSKALGLATGDTQYHLSILERSGKVKSRRIRLHRHYYSAEILGDKEELLFAFLRQETARDIIVYLMEHPRSTQIDIAKFKNFTGPTINWHMARLVESGLVLRERDGKNVRYTLQDNLKGLAYFLKSYHPDIWNRLEGRLAELFEEVSAIRADDKERTYDAD